MAPTAAEDVDGAEVLSFSLARALLLVPYGWAGQLLPSDESLASLAFFWFWRHLRLYLWISKITDGMRKRVKR